MKDGAKLTIATDHDLYKTWILAEVARSKKFSWAANSKKDWHKYYQIRSEEIEKIEKRIIDIDNRNALLRRIIKRYENKT